MQYRKDKKGRDLSLLGYGCMRFTRKGNAIDLDKAEREVTAAIEGGVNYLDTAYIYPGNEAAVGEILRRNGRLCPPSPPGSPRPDAVHRYCQCRRLYPEPV